MALRAQIRVRKPTWFEFGDAFPQLRLRGFVVHAERSQLLGKKLRLPRLYDDDVEEILPLLSEHVLHADVPGNSDSVHFLWRPRFARSKKQYCYCARAANQTKNTKCYIIVYYMRRLAAHSQKFERAIRHDEHFLPVFLQPLQERLQFGILLEVRACKQNRSNLKDRAFDTRAQYAVLRLKLHAEDDRGEDTCRCWYRWTCYVWRDELSQRRSEHRRIESRDWKRYCFSWSTPSRLILNRFQAPRIDRSAVSCGFSEMSNRQLLSIFETLVASNSWRLTFSSERVKVLSGPRTTFRPRN